MRRARVASKLRPAGFTLVEVLVAMAITALVAMVSYSALSAALSAALRDDSEDFNAFKFSIGGPSSMRIA